MTEGIRIPDVEDVLDWTIPTIDGGTKPLRYLTVDDLVFAASHTASAGDPWFADTLAAVAAELPDEHLVADLPRDRFHELFWATTADTTHPSEETL